MPDINRHDLDNYITGHHGEDDPRWDDGGGVPDPSPEPCPHTIVNRDDGTREWYCLECGEVVGEDDPIPEGDDTEGEDDVGE